MYSLPLICSVVPAVAGARAFHDQGRLDEAERLYTTVLEQAHAHPEALHLSGVLTVRGIRRHVCSGHPSPVTGKA